MQHEMITYDEALEHIALCDSYTRLPALLDIREYMKPSDFLRALGEAWEVCDNVSEHYFELVDSPLIAIDHAGHAVKREMMTADEIAAYEALPDVVTIYRGCYEFNRDGFSWSLSREIAEKFPKMLRYKEESQAFLLTAHVSKADIIAVKLGRDEAEVIAYSVEASTTQAI